MLPTPTPDHPLPAGADADTDIGPLPAAPMRPLQQMLADFLCSDPRQIHALMLELRDTACPVMLNAPDGSMLRATLWTVDAERGHMSFEVESNDLDLPSLVLGNECTAVAYLKSAKLQFDLNHLMLVSSRKGSALQTEVPAQLFRFQRREAYRVPTLERPTATAELRHPNLPDMRLRLRVLDISLGGCALQVPGDVPPLPLGIAVDAVRLQLDASTQLQTGLRLQHATSLGSPAAGLRLGCEWTSLAPGTQRNLQHYVDQLQRRRRLLARD